MLARVFQRRAFSTASLRFPEGTVAGHYKAAVAQNPEIDVVRFDSQRINWTLKELDVSRVILQLGLYYLST